LTRGEDAPSEDVDVLAVPPLVAALKGRVVLLGIPAPPIGDPELLPVMPTCASAPIDALASSAADNAIARTVRNFSIILTPFFFKQCLASKDISSSTESWNAFSSSVHLSNE
jgi:hypothetical protein